VRARGIRERDFNVAEEVKGDAGSLDSSVCAR
jgi:hypothetical protein